MTKGWDRPFHRPIDAGRGRVLTTLRDAGAFIADLSEAEQDLEHWRAAVEALLLVVSCYGDRLPAEIGVRKGLAGRLAPERQSPKTPRRKAAKVYKIVR